MLRLRAPRPPGPSLRRQDHPLRGVPRAFADRPEVAKSGRAKGTIERDGDTFYREPLEMKGADVEKLRGILADASTYHAFSGEKKCGGFHPDYAVEWSVGGEVRTILICFGCREAKASGPKGKTRSDLDNDAFRRLAAILKPYRKNRPNTVESDSP